MNAIVVLRLEQLGTYHLTICDNRLHPHPGDEIEISIGTLKVWFKVSHTRLPTTGQPCIMGRISPDDSHELREVMREIENDHEWTLFATEEIIDGGLTCRRRGNRIPINGVRQKRPTAPVIDILHGMGGEPRGHR